MQRLINMLHMLPETKIRVIRLHLESPACVIGLDNSDLCLDLCTYDLLTEHLQFRPHPFDFFITPPRTAVMLQQTMPILLGTMPRRSPAEENDSIRAMSDGLVRP